MNISVKCKKTEKIYFLLCGPTLLATTVYLVQKLFEINSDLDFNRDNTMLRKKLPIIYKQRYYLKQDL